MIAFQYGTVSDIEVMWTAISIAGLCYAVLNLRAAVLDVQALGPVTNGKRVVAKTSLKLEATRVVIQSVFAAIGMMAMTFPDPAQGVLPLRLVLFGALFRWGLITAALLVAYQSYENHKVRKMLVDGLTVGRRGPQGIQGVRGFEGPQGVEGPEGPPGPLAKEET